MKKRYVLLSLIIHSLFLLISLGGQGGDGQREDKADQKGRQGSEDHIVPKIIDIEMLDAPKPDKGELFVKKQKQQKKVDGVHECKGDFWFGGIGIQQDWRTGEIQEVYPGYPAESAGLKVGDKITAVDGTQEDRIRGEPGTLVQIQVFRPSTGEYLTFLITRGKICILEEKHEKP